MSLAGSIVGPEMFSNPCLVLIGLCEVCPRSLNFLPLIWSDAVASPGKCGGHIALQRGEQSQGQHTCVASELLWINPPTGGGVPEFDLIITHHDSAAFVVDEVFLDPVSRSFVCRPLLAPLARGAVRVL